jgi:hypothetical protein
MKLRSAKPTPGSAMKNMAHAGNDLLSPVAFRPSFPSGLMNQLRSLVGDRSDGTLSQLMSVSSTACRRATQETSRIARATAKLEMVLRAAELSSRLLFSALNWMMR